MNFIDLQAQWAAYDKKLDASIRLNLKLLREHRLDKTKSALQPLSRSIVLEVVIGLSAVVWLNLFIANHINAIQFLAPALALDVVVIVLVAFSVHQWLELRNLDFDAPILVLQKKLGALRIKQIRIFKWIILLAPLLWIPLLIVALKGVFGVNAYAVFNPAWLIANVLFGVAWIPLLLWVSQRYAAHMQRFPVLQRIMNELADPHLNAAIAFLDGLANFEREQE